ncbi:membrane-associated protein, putative, partial [Bodo saltans]
MRPPHATLRWCFVSPLIVLLWSIFSVQLGSAISAPLDCPSSSTPMQVRLQLESNMDYSILNCSAASPMRYEFYASTNVANVTFVLSNSVGINLLLDASIASATLDNVSVQVSNISNTYYTELERNISFALLYFHKWGSGIFRLRCCTCTTGAVLRTWPLPMNNITIVNSSQPTLSIVSNVLVTNATLLLTNISVRTIFSDSPVVLIDTSDLTAFTELTFKFEGIEVDATAVNVSDAELLYGISSTTLAFIARINRANFQNVSLTTTNITAICNMAVTQQYFLSLTRIQMALAEISVSRILLNATSLQSVASPSTPTVFLGAFTLQVLRMVYCSILSSVVRVSQVQVGVTFRNVTLFVLTSSNTSSSTFLLEDTSVSSSNAFARGIEINNCTIIGIFMTYTTSWLIGAYEVAVLTFGTTDITAGSTFLVSNFSRKSSSLSTPWIQDLDPGYVVTLQQTTTSGDVTLLLLNVTSSSSTTFESAFGVRLTGVQVTGLHVVVDQCSWESSLVFNVIASTLISSSFRFTDSTFTNISIGLVALVALAMTSSSIVLGSNIIASGTPLFRWYVPYALSMNVSQIISSNVTAVFDPSVSSLGLIGVLDTVIQSQSRVVASFEGGNLLFPTPYGVIFVAFMSMQTDNSTVVAILPLQMTRSPVANTENLAWAILVNISSRQQQRFFIVRDQVVLPEHHSPSTHPCHRQQCHSLGEPLCCDLN